ncbi:hypothetical protein RB599_010262 [Gaeumannomyces hyphopodioides]
MRSVFVAALFYTHAANAHFAVSSPPALGPLKDAEQGNSPCGGYTPDLAVNKAADFHVGGDLIATLSSHPQSNWLYRVTTDPAGAGNWTQIYPITLQSGIGSLCVPKVSVDESWVGKKAVLSIVANAPDGLLYQCSAITFIAGTGNMPNFCKNASSVSASFTSDLTLSALVGGNGSGSSGTASSSSPPSPTRSPNSAGTVPTSLAGLKVVLVTGVMAVVGALLF